MITHKEIAVKRCRCNLVIVITNKFVQSVCSTGSHTQERKGGRE